MDPLMDIPALPPPPDNPAVYLLEYHLEEARTAWAKERDRHTRLMRELGTCEKNIATWERTIANLQEAIGRLHAH